MTKVLKTIISLIVFLIANVGNAQIMKSTKLVTTDPVEVYDSLRNFSKDDMFFNPIILKGQTLVVRECEEGKTKGYRKLEFYSKIPEGNSNKDRIKAKQDFIRWVTPYDEISGHKYLIEDIIAQEGYYEYFLKLKDIDSNETLYLYWHNIWPYKDFYIDGYYKKLMELYGNKVFHLGINASAYNWSSPPPFFYDFDTNQRIQYEKGDLITAIDILFPTGADIFEDMDPKMIFKDSNGKLIYIDVSMMKYLVEEDKYQEYLQQKKNSTSIQ